MTNSTESMLNPADKGMIDEWFDRQMALIGPCVSPEADPYRKALLSAWTLHKGYREATYALYATLPESDLRFIENARLRKGFLDALKAALGIPS